MLPYLIAGAIGYGIAKLFEEDKAPKYADGGSVLLAPNGKPSNLTSEQYKLVRTPAFKKWFGDWENDATNSSKVVDENGEPLVVYHGTTQKFNVFKKADKLREDWGVRDYGMYFTNSEKTAQIYSLDFQKKTGQSEIIENKYQTALNKWMISKSLEDLEKVRQLSSERIELSSDLLNSFEKVRVIECFLNIRNPFLIDGKGQLWHQVLKGAIDIALTNQKDGMIVSNIIEVNHIIQTTYVAFNPEQIKIADGSNTTFDSNNPDIRFAGGGEITLLKNKIKAPFLNKLYGQDVEPSGYYAIEKKTNMFDSDDNYETKKIKYQNPLYIDVDTDTLISWKYELSNKYNAKGKKLTEKLIEQGYDVIITKYPNGDKGEIIVLDTSKLNNPDIRYAVGGQIYSKEYINKRIEWVLKMYRNLDEEEYSEIENNLYNFSNQDFPVGLYNLPKQIKLYRIIYLKSEKDFNKDDLGVHFIADRRLINDDFLWSIGITKKEYKKLYLISINVDSKYINIDWTLSYKARYPNEFEFTLKDNSKYEIESIEKYNPDIRFAGGGSVEELKFSNEIESDAMGYDIGDYLYHITPVSNFDTIINKGFIPKNGISINGKPFENRLYFATSLISAYDLSVNFGSYRDDAEYVIFKIKSDCIDDFDEDDLFAHGIYVDYKISNKCILGYVNANDLFNKFDDEDIENLYY
jgi:hypothetical protein